jgi:hypothetical protein
VPGGGGGSVGRQTGPTSSLKVNGAESTRTAMSLSALIDYKIKEKYNGKKRTILRPSKEF